jgi:hypothetical protein
MPKPTLLAGLSAVALLVAAGAAAAQSCGSEIGALARQYNLSVDTPREGSSEAPAAPPASSGNGATVAERAARAAGVIAPSDAGGTAAVQPPAGTPDSTRGAPEAAPPDGAAVGTGGLAAGDRTRMESLLQSALAAERQGKIAECLDLLRRAAAVPSLPGTK